MSAKPLATRIARIAVPTGLALALSGGIAFALTQPDTPQDLPVAEASAPHSAIVVPERGFDTSRNAARPTLKPTPTAKPTPKPTPKAKPTPTPGRAAATVKPAPPKAVDTKYVTVNLNVRLAPLETASLLTVLDAGTKVSVTGKTDGEWAQIIKDGKALWVKAEYLAEKMPPPETNTGGGISAAPCPSGSSVEDGLRPDTIRVHRAVCALFPSVSSYGGLRSGDGGEHGVGRALDIMISGSTGDEIAAYVRSNAKALGVSEVIWEQRIWTVERSSEGWRPMEDRGGATANHYDHVHVTTYGDSGTS
ncbi:SH3 domain-containing protein [Kribbella sp. NBC_01245]|uniref:SH3 domain-containing protein n=1 Tax=Kribbella sp. NBC_01245 TaxID=2903578 RepID=UPI002E2A72CD|nr:SH3 domain-containing protein [Kribbella sp. NBC_01245]